MRCRAAVKDLSMIGDESIAPTATAMPRFSAPKSR